MRPRSPVSRGGSSLSRHPTATGVPEQRDTAGQVDITALLSYRILLLSSTLARWASREYLKRFELKLPEWRILSIVGARGPVSVNEVAETLSIDKAWVSRTVPKLVKMGYLRTRADAIDRRRTMLEATRSGKALHEEMSRVSLARQERLVRPLKVAERVEFERLLKVLQMEADLLVREQRV